ncbi:hypothetical protein SEA_FRANKENWEENIE_222 [Streptomyces phage Frankenweenie]|nr:hypothetical protein SEA_FRANKENWEENIE_222 [Streptomyces phage Frankenweenie]
MDHEIDEITVIELPKRTGMSSGWPQQYRIMITPSAPGQTVPSLPFLHKGDGFTTLEGQTYWVESAKQVPVQKGYVYWTWVYTATRDTSDDPEPWDDTPFDSQFGR